MGVPQWAIDQGRALYTLPNGEQIVRSWENVNAGLIPVEELDDDELLREKLRDKEGQFRGRNHELVPRTLRKKLQAELMRRSVLIFQENLFEAQRTIVASMFNPSATVSEQLRAAVYVTERIVGKTPDKIEISAEIKPWEGIADAIVHDIEADDDPAALEAASREE